MSTFQTNQNESPVTVPARATANEVVFDHVRAALRGMQYGAVTIVVQNGRVVQIERHEKTRLNPND